MTTDLKLKTIDGVTALITKIASATIKKGDKSEDADSNKALEAIVNLVEQHGGYDAGISRAVDLVRKAYKLDKPKKEAPPPEETFV